MVGLSFVSEKLFVIHFCVLSFSLQYGKLYFFTFHALRCLLNASIHLRYLERKFWLHNTWFQNLPLESFQELSKEIRETFPANVDEMKDGRGLRVGKFSVDIFH